MRYVSIIQQVPQDWVRITGLQPDMDLSLDLGDPVLNVTSDLNSLLFCAGRLLSAHTSPLYENGLPLGVILATKTEKKRKLKMLSALGSVAIF